MLKPQAEVARSSVAGEARTTPVSCVQLRVRAPSSAHPPPGRRSPRTGAVHRPPPRGPPEAPGGPDGRTGVKPPPPRPRPRPVPDPGAPAPVSASGRGASLAPFPRPRPPRFTVVRFAGGAASGTARSFWPPATAAFARRMALDRAASIARATSMASPICFGTPSSLITTSTHPRA